MAPDIWTIAAASTAVFLMTFIPFTSQAYIFWNWLAFKTPNAPWLLLIPFDIAILSTWLNYFLTMLTDPGKVPKGYDPAKAMRELDLADGASVVDGKNWHASSLTTLRARPVVQELKKSTEKPRWCQKCMTFKPPRTHHCSYCKRCVLKMDHHCPWVGNCVGHYNHGYFVRFLVSVTFSAVYCLALIGWRMADLIRSQNPSEYYNFATGEVNPRYFYTPPAGNKEVLFMIIDIMLLFILLFTVGMMMGFHIYYACSNVTTIEHEENNTIAKLIRRKQISKDYQYPYDLGWYSNLSMVLGTRWWPLWFVPLPPPRGYDGTAFAVNAKLAKDGQPIVWPPPEYHEYRQNPYRRRYEDLSSSSEEEPAADSGSTDEEGTAGDNVRLYDLEVSKEGSENKFGRRHVRRSSEGYVVRDWTEEDREKMVKEAQERNAEKLYASYWKSGVGKTLPSVQHSANSFVGSPLSHSNSNSWDDHEAVDDDSDNEVLANLQLKGA